MRFSLAACLTMALCTFQNVLAQSRTYPPSFEGAREEVYKQTDQVDLKLWVFDPPAHKASDSRPAIVFFFGGGWKSGSPAQFEPHCRYLAEQGVVAITADYRVRERHQTLADRCVADAKSAIRYVRQHADRLGVDPNRIVAGGGSAGGHLAACCGVIEGLDEPTEDLQVSSLPNALALFNPAVLLAPFGDISIEEKKLAELATRTGVEPQRISPIHHVRGGLPPTIIFHGMADSTVSFASVERYTEVAVAAGNRCELAGYAGAGHGFFNSGRNGQPGEFYLATVHRLHRFLNSLGYLETDEPSLRLPHHRNAHLRGHYRNSLQAIERRREATVAFIGGSITEMKGYRMMVQELLTKKFPKTEFQFVNAGISSTCSTTGAFRLERDVLSTNPDLLFVEFAVNDDQDAAHAERECRRGMEGILRHARAHNPGIDIVVTHFINPPMLEKLTAKETPISSGTHETVRVPLRCLHDRSRARGERTNRGGELDLERVWRHPSGRDGQSNCSGNDRRSIVDRLVKLAARASRGFGERIAASGPASPPQETRRGKL